MRASWMVLALAGAGCGADVAAYCESREECTGGGERDVEACEVQTEAAADVASTFGCSDEFDAYYDCLNEKASCEDVPTGQPCSDDDDCAAFAGASCQEGQCANQSFVTPDEDDCAGERRAYKHCTDLD